MIINLNAIIKCKDHDGYKAQVVQERQWMLSKIQGDVIAVNTPDGPSDDFCWHITLENFFTCQRYVLNTIVSGRIREESYEDGDHVWYENGRNRADASIEQIKATGKVDLSRWSRI